MNNEMKNIESVIEDKLPKLIVDLVWAITDGGCKIKERNCLTYQDEPVYEFEQIKLFITQTILSREQAIREEIVGKLEGMKQQTDKKNEIPLAEALIQARNTGYNSALSDAIEEIKNIKE